MKVEVLAITRLKEFAFLSMMRAGNDMQKTYEMHKLVHEAVQYRLNMNSLREMGIEEDDQDGYHAMKAEVYFSQIAVDVMQRLFPVSSRETWEECEKYLAHALQVGDWAEVSGKQVEIVELLSRVSYFLHERGRWRERTSQ